MSATTGGGSTQRSSVSLKRPQLPNKNLETLNVDILYHFGISTSSHDLPAIFGDVKFVCCGGSASRMKKLACFLQKYCHAQLNDKNEPVNLSLSDRFVLYKVGPSLCVNHGIGIPSMLVMLHEVLKLVAYAGCEDVTFFRIGTCGGIGIDPGTVVISTNAVNACLEPFYESCAIGKKQRYSTQFSQEVIEDLVKHAANIDFPVVQGITMSCDDFYEAGGRMNGAVCSFTEEEKMNFLNQCSAAGVKNIEMEATGFAALTKRAGFKSATVCVTLVNRLLTDQVIASNEELEIWEERPIKLVAKYIHGFFSCQK